MAAGQPRYSCLSGFEHGTNIQDDVRHYFGCCNDKERRPFFLSIPDAHKQRIRDEVRRIENLRSTFEAEGQATKAGRLLRGFKKDFCQWRRIPKPPSDALPRPETLESEGTPTSKGKGKEVPVPLIEDDLDLVASMIWYKGGRPHDHPAFPDKFPNQKYSLHKLLFEKDETKNPLMIDVADDEFRYIHIPANNMSWVEEAIARYYHEDRPDLDGPYKKPTRREQSKTTMLLRPQYWRGLQHGRPDLPAHTRHMRPRCYDISIDPISNMKSKNLVLFMPYMHWETDRKRARAATIVKAARKAKLTSMSGVVDVAATAVNISGPPKTTKHEDLETSLRKIYTRPAGSRKITISSVQRQTLLGQILLRAAALKEHMDFDTDEKLINKYINAEPPLHPRRTLDQAYYWTLKDTEKRDRDQVVYRGTRPDPIYMHHENECQDEDKTHKVCQQCSEDVRKVPRIVMVDQLWMWILDEKTIITAFPRRFGRNKPDPSGVQKCIRTRLKNTREDEPLVMDNFDNAIGKLTHRTTIAFNHFWEYTRLASVRYDEEENTALQKTLLDINPEGKLLREIKDISDELYIMTLIKTQQRDVAKMFIKHTRNILNRHTLTGTPRPPSRHSDTDATPGPGPPSFVGKRPTVFLDDFSDADWTNVWADDLQESIQDQLNELNYLKTAAQNTELALKDLLGLKQQQAGVVEAREAVKQAEQTLRQGRSIMLFTIVTIIFLPLGFFSSIFGMNAKEINDSTWTLADEFKYMFPISFLVITISLLIAFSNLVRALLSSPLRILFTYVFTKTHLYILWHDLHLDSMWLKRKERQLVSSWKLEAKKEKLERENGRQQEIDSRSLEEEGVVAVTEDAMPVGASANGRGDVEKLGRTFFLDLNGTDEFRGSM